MERDEELKPIVKAYEKERKLLVAHIDDVKQKMLSKNQLVTLVGIGHRHARVLPAPVRATPPSRRDVRDSDGPLTRRLVPVAQSVADRLTCPQSTATLG